MESPECPKVEILWPLDNRPKEGLSIVPAVITSVGRFLPMVSYQPGYIFTYLSIITRVYTHLPTGSQKSKNQVRFRTAILKTK